MSPCLECSDISYRWLLNWGLHDILTDLVGVISCTTDIYRTLVTVMEDTIEWTERHYRRVCSLFLLAFSRSTSILRQEDGKGNRTKLEYWDIRVIIPVYAICRKRNNYLISERETRTALQLRSCTSVFFVMEARCLPSIMSRSVYNSY